VRCTFYLARLLILFLSLSAERLSAEENVRELEEHLDGIGIKGVALFADTLSVQPMASNESFRVYLDSNLPCPGPVGVLESKLLSQFENQFINQKTLLSIRSAILQYYAKYGEHGVYVEIPEQDISTGVVAFVLAPVKVQEVDYQGNQWFSRSRVEKALQVETGEKLNEPLLLNNVAWLNQNPFHYSEVVLSPGTRTGNTNVEVITKDRFPLRFYVGADNTGVESTGKTRFFCGMTWGDAFFVDDFLNYQFTSNNHYDSFHAHAVNYTSYLPWQHIFMLYGGYAEIHTDTSGFHGQGKEAQASFRYKIPFKPLYTNFQQQLYFGLDYKYETSALFFVSTLDFAQLNNAIANLTQWVLGYQLETHMSSHQVTFQSDFYLSPLSWFPHQTRNAYGQLRSHAIPYYCYGTIALGDIYTFPNKIALSALLRAQAASGALLPSEQFKLGGYNSVRGYEESVFISDNGICLNFELRTPPLSLLKTRKDQLTFLAFIDYGWGYNFYSFDGIEKTAVLWGIGPGARYNVNPYCSLRVDYGFKLNNVPFDDHPLGMWYLSGVIAY